MKVQKTLKALSILVSESIILTTFPKLEVIGTITFLINIQGYTHVFTNNASKMGISVHRAILEFPDCEHKPSNSLLLLEPQGSGTETFSPAQE